MISVECARCHASSSCVLLSCDSQTTWEGNDYYSYFTKWTSEAQRGWVTSSCSHSWAVEGTERVLSSGSLALNSLRLGPPVLTLRLFCLPTLVPLPPLAKVTWKNLVSHILIVGLDNLIPSTSSSLYCGSRATSPNHRSPKALLSSQWVFWGLLNLACSGLICFKLQPWTTQFSSPNTKSQGHRGSPGARREPSPAFPRNDAGSPLLSPGYM